MVIPFFITVPHAGEKVPVEATWLKGLVEPILMSDVDRYVDQFYVPVAETFGLPVIAADIHRYVVDLNRIPEDIDQDAVAESSNPPGLFTTGFHWSQTMNGARLIKKPISMKLHQQLTQKYFQPFHEKIEKQYADFKTAGFKKIYHLDGHSMPSKGTVNHRDPGGERPQIVVSDRDGTSCDPRYKDIVIESYRSAGFEVSYNWPYKGGRITETYGKPQNGRHAIQVEMNRNLYMDEITKKKKPEAFLLVQKQVMRAVGMIVERLK